MRSNLVIGVAYRSNTARGQHQNAAEKGFFAFYGTVCRDKNNAPCPGG